MLGNILIVLEWLVAFAILFVAVLYIKKGNSRRYLTLFLGLYLIKMAIDLAQHFLLGDRLSYVMMVFPIILVAYYFLGDTHD